MKQVTLLIAIVMMTLSASSQEKHKTFYDFTVQTIDGKSLSLSEFRGKKVLVVNTASKCGLTPQYEKLQALYEQYGGDDFVIIGFPANNFMNQEPGSNEEIKSFCSVNYGVTFPMMAKISVKGDDIHPLYSWLTQKSENGVMDAPVEWNFQKFMIGPDGTLQGLVPPREAPDSERIISWITGNERP